MCVACACVQGAGLRAPNACAPYGHDVHEWRMVACLHVPVRTDTCACCVYAYMYAFVRAEAFMGTYSQQPTQMLQKEKYEWKLLTRESSAGSPLRGSCT